MSVTKSRLTIAIMALGIIVLATSCSGEPESGTVKIIKKKTKVRVTSKTVDYSNNAGRVVVDKKAELPGDFPRDFPIYSPSILTSTLAGDKGAGTTSLVMYESTSSVAEITKFYESNLPALGWTVSGNGSTGADYATFNVEKQGLSMSVTVNTNTYDNKAILSISVTQ